MQSDTKRKHFNLVVMKIILRTDRLWLWWLKVTQSTGYIFPVTELSVSDHHWYFHKDWVVFTDTDKWVAEIPLFTMEMSPTVEVRHCSPTPEYPFTPEPVKHHSFAVKFISTITHLTLLLSLVYSSPSLEVFEAIWSFPSTAVDHWRGQEEGFLAPSLTNTNHYQKWRWFSWALSAHDMKQLSLTMATKFIFYWQKLTDSLSQPTGMLHVPWHPSCCLCDQVLRLIQKKTCKL